MTGKPMKRCMGPWPACGHARDTCTADPGYQEAIAAKRPPSPLPVPSEQGNPLAEIGDAILRLRHAFLRHGLGSPDLVLASINDVMKLRMVAGEGPWTSFPRDEELERGVVLKLVDARLYHPRPE